LAALAIGVRGDLGSETLFRLLDDADVDVISAASRAAGFLKDRHCVFPLVRALAYPRLRGDAISALAAFGDSICGSLSDILLDESAPIIVRRQIPRVLKRIPSQRSVDVLLSAVGHSDLTLRAAVLKGLNRLRETAPSLNFENTFVSDQILREARDYVELSAALEPFRDPPDGHPATTLLARSIEDRLRATLGRLFRLLGLRYPPKEIYSAYLAVSRQSHEETSAAIEFLDNVLERDLKKTLLPLFEAPEHVLEFGRDHFGVNAATAESAIRELIRSGDPWLTPCAMAAAAELQLRSLAPEIAQAAQQSQGDVSEVARSAEAALAA
jgi:AAA family ATP:ADP antiporter